MAFEISRTSLIGELVLNHPVAATVLLEHGFHCIGCGFSSYDSLESGAAVHGFDDAQIDALVQEIKDAAKKEEELLNQAAEKSKAAAQKSEEPEKMPADKESKKTAKKSKTG